MAGYCTLSWCLSLMLFAITCTAGQEGGCENKKDLCDEWAVSGECVVNRIWMASNCPRSCGACPDQGCVNENGKDESCDEWAFNGECKANQKWMEENCARACGLCNVNPSSNLPDQVVNTEDSAPDPAIDQGTDAGPDLASDTGSDPASDPGSDPGQDPVRDTAKDTVQDVKPDVNNAKGEDNNGSNAMVVSLAIGLITLLSVVAYLGLRH